MKTQIFSLKSILFFFSLAMIFSLSCQSEKEKTQQKSVQNESIPITDTAITNEVEFELLFNSMVPSHLIDVSTTNGIVQLSGSVNSLLAKDKATELARMVKGVEGVINKIKINPPEMNDATLEARIEHNFVENPAIESYNLDVQVDDQIVTISGTVNSWQEKQLAATLAKKIKGTKDIVNNVTFLLREKERESREIEAEIKNTLEFDVRIDHVMIEVNVDDDVVKLSGVVGSAAEKNYARSIAWVAGVDDVDVSNLKVERWARDPELRKNKYIFRSDSAIKTAVKKTFIQDSRILLMGPVVEVNNGIVTLKGKTISLQSKRAAGKNAQNIVGVWNVINKIKVRPQNIPEDKKLKRKVKQAFEFDPVLFKHKIDINASNGEIYINGSVNSIDEKQHATKVASGVKGVVNVENNLVIRRFQTKPYPYYLGDPDLSRHAKAKPDQVLQHEVFNQLFWSPYINDYEVDVTVKNGKVTLKGNVETWREKVLAEKNAYQAGATSVDNQLTVEYLP